MSQFLRDFLPILLLLFFGDFRCVVSLFMLFVLLSTPMGVDYVVIGFDMEVQPLVTHNAA